VVSAGGVGPTPESREEVMSVATKKKATKKAAKKKK
jgi:hypothetical protein